MSSKESLDVESSLVDTVGRLVDESNVTRLSGESDVAALIETHNTSSKKSVTSRDARLAKGGRQTCGRWRLGVGNLQIDAVPLPSLSTQRHCRRFAARPPGKSAQCRGA